MINMNPVDLSYDVSLQEVCMTVQYELKRSKDKSQLFAKGMAGRSRPVFFTEISKT